MKHVPQIISTIPNTEAIDTLNLGTLGTLRSCCRRPQSLLPSEGVPRTAEVPHAPIWERLLALGFQSRVL